MLTTREPDATYCCVKSFVRDCSLQQPPELCLRPGQLARVGPTTPATILPRKPLGEKEILDALQLAKLCADKYGMPAAATSLRDYVYTRDYEVPALPWLHAQSRPQTAAQHAL